MAEYEKGYGKRPLWLLILLYIVIGGIIYAAIYYFVLNKGSYKAPASSGGTQQLPKGGY